MSSRVKRLRDSRVTFSMWIFVLIFTLFILITLGVSVGSAWVPPDQVWLCVASHLFPAATDWNIDPMVDAVVWELRVPRVIFAVVVGAGLSIAGAVLQAVTRNPLADPYVLGSTAGGSLGAVLVIIFGSGALGQLSMSMAAFIGALGALGLVIFFGRTNGKVMPMKLVLVGVAVSSTLTAIVHFVVMSAKNEGELKTAMFWILGMLSGARWYKLPIPMIGVFLVIVWLLYRGPQLNAISVGDETAITLGVNASRFRIEMIILAALLVGTTVALSGGIGFIALVMPHVARLLVGSDHRKMMGVCVLLGAQYLIITDIFCRAIISPREIPVGVVTAIIGGPALLYLLNRRNSKLREST